MIYIDRYSYCNRLINVHPMEKFFFAMATMFICLAGNSIFVLLLILFLMAGVTVFKGGIPLSFIFKLMLIPFAFLIISTLTIAVNVIHDTGNLVWGFGAFGTTLGITKDSINHAAVLFVKALGSVSCLYFLSLTTPMVDIISILRRLKVPTLFVELMSLIYRFIFVLMNTSDRIFTSQTSRLGYFGLKNSYNSLGQLATTLFVRSYKRSQDLFTALESRCYNGDLKVLEQQYHYSGRNITLILAVDIVLFAALLFLPGGILR